MQDTVDPMRAKTEYFLKRSKHTRITLTDVTGVACVRYHAGTLECSISCRYALPVAGTGFRPAGMSCQEKEEY